MSGHRYVSNPNNLFEDDDIDDETFLKNSRRGTNPFADDDRQLQMQKVQEIENRTLASSNRSLGLLYETEQVGIATAEELARQREQLENTNRNLDDINQRLRFSQKHLNGIKSIFGGLKNYISGQKDMQPSVPSASSSQLRKDSIGSNQPISPTSPTGSSSYDSQQNNFTSNNFNSFDDQLQAPGPTNFKEQLNRNLDEMAGNLSRLKGLALDLNTEIDDHNDLIDNITNKVENVDSKIIKQNKEINQLLGKK